MKVNAIRYLGRRDRNDLLKINFHPCEHSTIEWDLRCKHNIIQFVAGGYVISKYFNNKLFTWHSFEFQPKTFIRQKMSPEPSVSCMLVYSLNLKKLRAHRNQKQPAYYEEMNVSHYISNSTLFFRSLAFVTFVFTVMSFLPLGALSLYLTNLYLTMFNYSHQVYCYL
ncbi:hypothetical protein AB4K20DRAFT_1871209 [Rhizopus microsporus]|uniref:Uncharacterized protein n=1 Tax=Rhizopus microsporus TaxID=58291 RepID=A0A1X0S5S0_RHIZD|nr:hypothetical protein BCV71DRAFT_233900 [Rhizopus microsporus]